MSDPLAAISALVTPVERALATDPRLWRALNPHRGSLPVAAADALQRLAGDLKPTLEALSRIEAPANTKAWSPRTRTRAPRSTNAPQIRAPTNPFAPLTTTTGAVEDIDQLWHGRPWQRTPGYP